MKKRLLLFLLTITTIAHCYAQDYVYSVTTGTAWAREEFPNQERIERKKIRERKLVLEGAPNFGKTFLDFEYDYKKYNAYNDSIFYNISHEEWIEMFKRRAKEYSRLYSKNNIVISNLKDYFENDNVPEAAYDSLYYWTRHLYFRNVNDIFMYETLMDILVPHYESTQDIEHLVFCYLCSGMYKFQCSRMGDKEAERRSELYFHKIMSFTDSFGTFKDPLNRFYLISAFINLSILHTQSGNLSLYESNELASSMKKMYATEANQNILKNDSLLNEFAKWSLDLYSYRAILTYFSRNNNIPALRDQLYESYCNVRKELGLGIEKKLKNRYYGKIEYDDLLIEAFMGNLSWDKAFDKFDKMMQSDKELLSEKGVPSIKINYLYNLFESYTTILERTSFSEQKKSEITKTRLNKMLDMISRYEHSRYPFEKGRILENIALKPYLLHYLNAEESRDLIFRLIVVEQPTTYVHVSMVADMSVALAEGIINDHPEYFKGVPGYDTPEDVTNKKAELLNYIREAAIFHDLGKISMPTVINNCFRKLTDHEFEIIKLHPEKARPFFTIDKSLDQYKDIALGHHKWFDGDGYPASFKNRKSPYFPIICLVTLCDCMDAATENIGRNYHTPKSFEKVMSEFEQSIGEQYNPFLINYLNEHKDIYNKIKSIVNTGRYDNYYKLYMRYMQKN